DCCAARPSNRGRTTTLPKLSAVQLRIHIERCLKMLTLAMYKALNSAGGPKVMVTLGSFRFGEIGCGMLGPRPCVHSGIVGKGTHEFREPDLSIAARAGRD